MSSYMSMRIVRSDYRDWVKPGRTDRRLRNHENLHFQFGLPTVPLSLHTTQSAAVTTLDQNLLSYDNTITSCINEYRLIRITNLIDNIENMKISLIVSFVQVLTCDRD